eukprot:9472506-Pyramimonas_sp.AAC.1
MIRGRLAGGHSSMGSPNRGAGKGEGKHGGYMDAIFRLPVQFPPEPLHVRGSMALTLENMGALLDAKFEGVLAPLKENIKRVDSRLKRRSRIRSPRSCHLTSRSRVSASGRVVSR